MRRAIHTEATHRSIRAGGTKRSAFSQLLPLLMTFVAALASLSSQASCLPLPDSRLRKLDTDLLVAPERVLIEANDRLAHLLPTATPLEGAQLHAIMAESSANLDRTDAAMAAIAKGIELLQAQVASAAANRVRLRLELLRAELLSVRSNGAAAGATIDKLLPGLVGESLGRACALSQRAIAYDFVNEPDHAVNAALTAHRLAVDHGWTTPRIDTAYTLAVNFRRAGIYDQAEKMIDEVISLETAGDLKQSLSQAYYERGQLLVAMGRYSAARAALDTSIRYAVAVGDRLTAAAAGIPLCLAEINEPDLVAADSACKSDIADSIAVSRPDLAMLLQSYQARLELALHHPAKAIAKLDVILSGPIHHLLPVQESQIYSDRGRAFGQMRRYAEAFADLAHAQTLATESGIEMRDRQVAILSALIESERLRADNRLLEIHLKQQQQGLLEQRRAGLLAAAVAAASLIMCGLLLCFLLIHKRHTRRLRRYEIILSHAWSRAPQAMLMLDEHRLVCFANRPLLGVGSTPVVGASLFDNIPSDLLQEITSAIDTAFETGCFQRLELVVHQDEVRDRHYDVLLLPAIDAGEALGIALQSIDVTDLWVMERQFLDGTSRERLQLGGQLHEELAQELAGVLLMLSSLSKSLRRVSPDSAYLITEAAEQLAQSISSARRMAHDLAPVNLERGSLADALQRLMESGTQRLGVTASCECFLEACTISNVAADHVYQFCRDALIEAVFTERCLRIQFVLRIIKDSLVVQVTGDPQSRTMAATGHDEEPAKILVFRARLLGGRVRLRLDPVTGFCVTLTIPTCQLHTGSGAEGGMVHQGNWALGA